MPSFIRLLFAFLAIYLCMVARWGYEYSRGDQMQIISYAKYMNDESLFAKDFYVQGISAKVPNERYIFTKFMAMFGDHMEGASLALHAIFTLLLLALLFAIAKEFIESDYLIWLGLLFLFVFLYGINLGGNELYYNTFFVSTPAKVVGLYGIWLFLKDKYLAAYLVFGLTVLLQPVVGIQLFVTCTGILILGNLLKRYNYSWLEIGKWMLGFLLTGGVWIFILKFYFEENVSEDIDFFTIFFEFRAPHHYVPDAFSTKSYLLLIPLMLFGLGYYTFKHFKLALFFLISLLGMTFYTLAFYGLRDVNLATLQWFKMVIWLKPFALFAVIALIESFIDSLKNENLQKLAYPVLLAVGGGVLIVLLFSKSLFFWNVPFDFGDHHQQDPAVTISLMAKQKTPKDALFIYPIDFTELKSYGERSGYADYKALSHRKTELSQWYKRTEELYGINRETQLEGKVLFEEAHQNFRSLTTEKLLKLSQTKGITHLLTWADHTVNLPVVAKNEAWIIYKITE